MTNITTATTTATPAFAKLFDYDNNRDAARAAGFTILVADDTYAGDREDIFHDLDAMQAAYIELYGDANVEYEIL